MVVLPPCKEGLPEGLLNLLIAMYTCVMAFSSDNSEDKVLDMFSGILQGCPLSGCLLVIAINPLLIALEGISSDKKQTVVKAWADDIGIVLQQLRPVPRVAELFALLERISALQLKAAKCAIVPAADQDIASFQSAAAVLLAETCPS